MLEKEVRFVMRYRNFGATDLKVSEIGLGTWQIGGPCSMGGLPIGLGDIDDKTSKRILTTAFDCGINFFDTADAYGLGHSEELIGEVFRNKRDRIIISSKFGIRKFEEGKFIKDFSPAWAAQALESSLKRLKTDYIDLYQLHSPLADYKYSDEIVEALEKMKKQGKIRFYGVSTIPPGKELTQSEQCFMILNSGKQCHFFQVVYNILERQVGEQFLPICREKGKGIIARVPLCSGFLTGKYSVKTRFPKNDFRSISYPPVKIKQTVEKVKELDFLFKGREKSLAQASIQFCLANSAVSTVIAGAKTPQQVMENTEACEKNPLTKEDLELIESM
jgi:aryl-alcohol dehydrogenase-like predicted oxidoreductase